MATAQPTELNDLVGQVKDLFLTSLQCEVWLSRSTLLSEIPNDLAEALCRQTSAISLQDTDDPTSFAREKLLNRVIKLLVKEELGQIDGPEGEERLRLFESSGMSRSSSSKKAKRAGMRAGKTEACQPQFDKGDGKGAGQHQAAQTPAEAVQAVLPAGQDGDQATSHECEKTLANGEASCPNLPSSSPVKEKGVSPADSTVQAVDPNLLVHNVAYLFPEPTDEEFAKLKKDIETNGQAVPAWTYRGQLIDGRTRMRIARDLGQKLLVREWAGPGSPLTFVVSLNLHRRHLTESQRSMMGAKIKPLFDAEAKERMLAGRAADPMANVPQGAARDQAAQAVGVCGRSIDAASKVMAQGVPELIHAVEAGGVSVSAAAEVAELPKDEQAAVVASGRKRVAAKAKERREQKKKGGKSGQGKSKAKKAAKDKQMVVTASEPAAVAGAGLEATVTISLPAEIKGAGKALAEALVAHWDRVAVLNTLVDAVGFLEYEWMGNSGATAKKRQRNKAAGPEQRRVGKA